MWTKGREVTHTRRRVLGRAAAAVLAAHLGGTGAARAQTPTTTAGGAPAGEESPMTTVQRDTTPDADLAAVRPFRVEVPPAALDDLRRRLAATRFPDRETV